MIVDLLRNDYLAFALWIRSTFLPCVQALCFLAGANSIFIGDVLLTTKNPQRDRDANLLDRLGISCGPTK